jgi:hypothetical protein
MKKSPTILLALLALAATPAAATARSEPAGDPAPATPWQTVAATGPVQARTADEVAWQEVARGDELWPRTLVQTGRKGRATLTRRANLVILDPQSRLELPGEGLAGLETSVVQTEGSVLYKVDSRSEPHFEVVTPFLVAGVKGTSFLVTVNERYASVTVEHGLVEITNPATGEVLELGPGETIIRQREDLEMELVRDERRSRQARHEARRLERMQAALDRGKERVEDEAALPADAKLSVKDATGDPVEGSDAVDVRSADSTGALSVEDLTNEMIQELIREGVRDGAIVPPPAKSGGSGPGGDPDDDVLEQPN